MTKLSIRKKMFFFILFATLLCLLIISSIALSIGKSILKNEASEKVDYALNMLALDFKKNVVEAEKVVDILNNAVSYELEKNPLHTEEDAQQLIDNMDTVVKSQAQNHKQSYTAYFYLNPFLFNQSYDVYYADESGNGIVTRQNQIPLDYYSQNEPNIDKSWWFGPINTENRFWTKPYDWTLDNGKTLRFVSHTVPIYHNNDFLGVVGTDMNYSYLIDLISAFHLYETGFAFLLNGDGELIYSPSSLTDTSDLDRILFTKPITENWTVGISISEHEMYSQLNNFNIYLFGAIGILILIFSIISHVFSNTISKPILNIISTIQKSKQQNMFVNIDPRLIVRNDEIGSLARTMEEYNKELFEVHNELRLIDEALEYSDNGLFITNQYFKLIYVNKTFKNITQSNPIPNITLLQDTGIQIEKDLLKQLDTLNSIQTETLQKRVNGNVYPLHLYVTKLENPKTYYLGILKDLTQQKIKEKQFHEMRFYDVLTQLPNREHFLDLGKKKILNESDSEMLCIIVNIDNFRLLNNLIGGKQCDELLIEISNRISNHLVAHSVYGRTDGDEFSMLVSTKPSEKLETLHQIKSILSNAYITGEETTYLTFSIGFSHYPQDGDTIYKLMKKSNIALTKAKAYGKNQMIEYKNTEIESDGTNYEVYKHLRYAVKNNEMFLQYQPQVNALTGAVVGVEALLRWKYNGMLIPPSEFIPIAEESKWIVNIGYFVLESSFQFTKRFHAINPNIKLSINLSVEQLKHDIILAQLKTLEEKYDINPDKITFEVTENILVTSSSEAIDVIHILREKGYQIALDDFGMGYSTLNYLKDVPFDCIKLDRAFIKDYPDQDNGSIASLIVRLAQELQVDIIAEGVETEDQKNYLLSKGSAIIQGYYYSKPLDEDQLMEFIISS